MAVLTITKDNFQSEVMQSDKPVLLDFWASWCGPCRMVSPIVDEIAEERADIKVGKINVDEQGELAQQFGVMSIPTLVVMKNGQIANKRSAPCPRQTFWRCCKSILKRQRDIADADAPLLFVRLPRLPCEQGDAFNMVRPRE